MSSGFRVQNNDANCKLHNIVNIHERKGQFYLHLVTMLKIHKVGDQNISLNLAHYISYVVFTIVFAFETIHFNLNQFSMRCREFNICIKMGVLVVR